MQFFEKECFVKLNKHFFEIKQLKIKLFEKLAKNYISLHPIVHLYSNKSFSFYSFFNYLYPTQFI